jgi:LacI family transcriptional regulator
MAINHLLKSGRKHLAYVGMSIDTYAGSERCRGFELTLRNTGFTIDKARQITFTDSDPINDFEPIRQLLESNPLIDGLVCFNDEVAARTLRVCADMGRRVPDEIAVIGYDDIYLAELLTPTLTTLRLKQSKQEVGAMAARMLLERMENDAKQTPVVLNHDLIIRDSAP